VFISTVKDYGMPSAIEKMEEKEHGTCTSCEHCTEDVEKQASQSTESVDRLSRRSTHSDTDEITPSSLPQHRNSLSKTKSATVSVLNRVATRLTTRSLIDPGPPPDGGLKAWTQCFCAWLVIMNTWGFVNSFGAFQTYYATLLPGTPPSTISWIGSVQAFLMFFLGAFSGRALDAGFFVPTVLVGIFFQLVGIFTMSCATKYWQLFLTQGVLTGIGGGIFFCPSMGLLSTYFQKRRGLALGLATTGNSMGGIVYPVIVRELLPKIGFGWTVCYLHSNQNRVTNERTRSEYWDSLTLHALA
jgi:hypothetical protein